jgi:hypothetical protein
MAGMPTAGFFGDILNIGKTIAGALIPGVGTAIDIVETAFGGKDKAKGKAVAVIPQVTPFAPSVPTQLQAGCPSGTRMNPTTGICEKVGFVGTVERLIPGGATGTAAATVDAFGEAVIGAFGRPALVPAMASTMTHRCPRGTILGRDNLCYEKLPREFRKWKPAPKPPMSAKDWKTLQTAERVRAKSKDIASKAGFTCRKK